jgi:hypothetical protein
MEPKKPYPLSKALFDTVPEMMDVKAGRGSVRRQRALRAAIISCKQQRRGEVIIGEDREAIVQHSVPPATY